MRLVLLPGLDGTGDLFAPFVAAAPPGFELHVISLPPLSRYEELLVHVRAHLPSGRFAVLGESFSGPLAVAVARAEPQRTAAVILCNSLLSPPLGGWPRFLPWSLLFMLPPPRWVVRGFFVGRDAAPALVASVRDAVAKTPRNVLAARMRSVFQLSRDVASIGVPLLSLTGSGDLLVRAQRREIARIAPTATFAKIDGPHLLLQARPEAAWAEIGPFLRASAR